jgi:hypothetical protein
MYLRLKIYEISSKKKAKTPPERQEKPIIKANETFKSI